jgi:hypothetical protein
MADLSITAANVIPSEGAVISSGTVGGTAVTVVAGKLLYRHTDGTLLLATNATAVGAAVVGMALGGAGTGQVVRYVSEDPDLTLGATATVGDPLYLTTAGGCSILTEDLDIGEFVTFLGITTVASSKVNFKIVASGFARTTNQI